MLNQKQSNLIYNLATSNQISDVNNDLIVYFDPSFYNKKQSDYIFEQLLKQVEYDKKSSVMMFGKDVLIPRKQAGYGDDNTTYSFSGITVKSRKWIPILHKIKTDVEKITGHQFNFCLVNYYENGSQYIGYHRDDENDLVAEPWIASISFGQKRKFYFKSIDPTLDVVKLNLTHGSLCVMIDPTNANWKHSVPKQSTATSPDPRINLTFRMIINDYQ